jgi:hypothetical protein
MIATPELIERLAAEARPVRRLRPPVWRAACWLALAVTLIGTLAVLHGTRADLGARLTDRWFVAGQAAAALTGVLAALAAFMLSLPDRSRLWLALPLPAAVAWLATVSVGCLTNWVRFDPAGMQWGETANCFATLLLAAVPLSGVMFWMLRHAARLRPTPAILSGGLAVAALTAAALSLLHAFEASAMVLLWNFGTALLVLAADAAAGRRFMRRMG